MLPPFDDIAPSGVVAPLDINLIGQPSPYTLSSSERVAPSLLFTGAANLHLVIVPTDGARVVENATAQTVRLRPAIAPGREVPLAAGECKLIAVRGNRVLSVLLERGAYFGTFSPSQLPLVAWFDFSTSSGVSLATGPAPQLLDLSGHGRHGTQANPSLRASWVADVQGGFGALRLAQAGSSYSLPVANQSEFTFALVCSQDLADTGAQYGLASNAAGNLALAPLGQAGVGWFDGGWKGTPNRAGGLQLLTWTLRTGGLGTLHRNGQLIFSTPCNPLGLSSMATLFSWVGQSTEFLRGDVCEIVLTQNALADAQRVLLDDALMGKWGL